jgi:hypothetical protein
MSRDCPRKGQKPQPNNQLPQWPQTQANKQEDNKTTQVSKDEEKDNPLAQLHTLCMQLGKGAFSEALDKMITKEDF